MPLGALRGVYAAVRLALVVVLAFALAGGCASASADVSAGPPTPPSPSSVCTWQTYREQGVVCEGMPTCQGDGEACQFGDDCCDYVCKGEHWLGGSSWAWGTCTTERAPMVDADAAPAGDARTDAEVDASAGG